MNRTSPVKKSKHALKEHPAFLYRQLRIGAFEQPREWDFAKDKTQYSTHGLHTYLAAMNPPLARRLIQTYVPEGGSVLDPFCGGGAVLVESVLNNCDTTGRDVNDLAVLISSAKTTFIEQSDILTIGKQVLKCAKEFDGEPLQFSKADYIHYWFKPYMLVPLTGLRLAVDKIKNLPLRNLFRVIFSATVRDVSLTYRNEIRLRRLSVDEQLKFNPDVFARFHLRTSDAALRVSQLPVGARANVAKGNVTKMSFRDEEFTTIVCSPPYGDERNGVPYVQFAKNMLLWLGIPHTDIQKAKQETLGWKKEDKKAPPSNELGRLLETIRANPTAVREAIAFYADYYAALREMARVVKQRVIIVIGQRVLNNTVFDNALITTELMESLGVQLESLHSRTLPTKRLPKLRANGGGAIDQEIMLVFHK